VASGSKGAVVGALIGNSLLTVIKFAAFLMSGSGALFSETMHSAADCANQALLFVGIRSSERQPDELFPYGYGGDRYLFSLLSAVGIFVLGCGVTVYHAVHGLLHPEPIEASWLPYVVLTIAFFVDGLVLFGALRAVSKKKGDKSLVQFLRTTSDPTIAAVLLEDGVACLGVIIAGSAIAASEFTGDPVWDSIGGLLVGLMMGGIAIWLGIKNRTLLLGPAIPRETRAEIIAFLESRPSILRVRTAKSRIVGAERFRFMAEVDFDGAYLGRKLRTMVSERADGLSDEATHERFAAEFGERLVDMLAEEVDDIERAMAKKFPDVAHLDLEAD
jgi:zinc transporter 9